MHCGPGLRLERLSPAHQTRRAADIFAAIKEQKGRLDVVLANARMGSFYCTNDKGTVFTPQRTLPLMGEGGTVVINASGTSVKGTPAFSIYSSTKVAVRNLARSRALDLIGRGIRVNVVSPGVVPTPAYDTFGMSKEQAVGFTNGWQKMVDSQSLLRTNLPCRLGYNLRIYNEKLLS